ncbi:uncharacterized protein BDZ83DRAFT_266646 [Colletotrichum acutatum]|uniref:Uncharacterized protein n=1 Tax=Glomerella acutata TaxID=27357 RepID=A0AAD8XFS6_GLOAC|nr:uncharacterized protein BDZ83DRAFT_266646 [Colletotrichum acutatum]KAK1726194.1 hypothetical protein BDZ83DRAFT_266646 [Colletotrichum acutatum]
MPKGKRDMRSSRAEYAHLVCNGSQKRRRMGSGTRRAPTASYVCLVCPCTAEQCRDARLGGWLTVEEAEAWWLRERERERERESDHSTYAEAEAAAAEAAAAEARTGIPSPTHGISSFPNMHAGSGVIRLVALAHGADGGTLNRPVECIIIARVVCGQVRYLGSGCWVLGWRDDKRVEECACVCLRVCVCGRAGKGPAHGPTIH